LNLLEIEVLKTTRAVVEFQKTPDSLVEALCSHINGEDNDAIGVALDPGVLVDLSIGEGTWAATNDADRNVVYNSFRRLLAQLTPDGSSVYGPGARVLKVNGEPDKAEAIIIDRGILKKLHLVRSGASWFLREVTYEDVGHRVIEEGMRQAITALDAKRKGVEPAKSIESVEYRILKTRGSDPEQGIKIAEQALKEKPGNQLLLHLKAFCLYEASETHNGPKAEEAIKIWTALGNETPVFPQALRELGSRYSWAEDDDPELRTKQDKAIEALAKYAALVPEDPRPHETIARIHERRREFGAAETAFRKVIELDPLNRTNYSNLAVILLKQQRYKEGLEVVDRSKGRGADKDAMFAGLLLSGFSEEGGSELAEGLAAAAPERFVTNLSANLNLALIRVENGRAAEAIPLLRKAAEIDPTSSVPHSSMAEAYRKIRNWAAALKSADQAIKLNAEDAEGHFHRACALAQLRRRVEAIAALKKAVELGEDLFFTDDLEEEEDLKPLAAMPAFKELLKEMKGAEEEQVPPETKKSNN
jgi:tetratricopeptide (TPR) repeat protein